MPSQDWNAKLYQDKHAFVYGYGQSLIELLEPKPNEAILDLGCGSGQLTHEIAQTTSYALGLDSSPDMIQSAKDQYPGVDFRVADAANFQVDERFDAIFSNAALHWVKDFQGAIKSMHAHLKPGGRLVAEFGGKGNIQTILSALQDTLDQYGYSKQAQLTLWYFPSIGEYCTALENGGFRVTFAHHYDRPTELDDEQTGVIDWLSMFAGAYFHGVDPEHVAAISQQVQEIVRPTLCQNGKWRADYKRLRVVAYKR